MSGACLAYLKPSRSFIVDWHRPLPRALFLSFPAILETLDCFHVTGDPLAVSLSSNDVHLISQIVRRA